MLKKVICIIVAFILGPVFTYMGIQEVRTAKRLNSEGKLATAKALEGETRVSSRRTKYYLTVEFTTDTQQTITKKLPVSGDVFRAGRDTKSVRVRYLPAAPEVCAVGEQAEVNYGTLIIGVVMMVVGGFLIVVFKLPASTEEAAEGVAKAAGLLTVKGHEYAPARADDFSHLDLAWYDRSRQTLEALGFTLLQDVQNLTVDRAGGTRTLLRLFASRDGTAMACLYHLKPGWFARVVGAKATQVLDVDTQFANGEWVCTSNAESAGAIHQPTSINALYLAAATPQPLVIEAHQKRVSAYVQQHPGVAAVRVASAEDVFRAQNALQAIKSAFRAGRGLSRDELQQMAGGSSDQLEEVRRQANQILQPPPTPPAGA